MEVKTTEAKIKSKWDMGYLFFPRINSEDPQGREICLSRLPSQLKRPARNLLRKGVVFFRSEWMTGSKKNKVSFPSKREMTTAGKIVKKR